MCVFYLNPYFDGKSITDDATQTCPKEHHVPYGEPKSLPLYVRVIGVYDEQIKKRSLVFIVEYNVIAGYLMAL